VLHEITNNKINHEKSKRTTNMRKLKHNQTSLSQLDA